MEIEKLHSFYSFIHSFIAESNPIVRMFEIAKKLSPSMERDIKSSGARRVWREQIDFDESDIDIQIEWNARSIICSFDGLFF